MPRSFFDFASLELRYDPFPIGLAKPVMDAALYAELVASYPSIDRFAELGKVGKKFTLSEKFNGAQYQDFIRGNALWREFHDWVKSDAFPMVVLRALKERDVDLGYKLDGSRPRQLFKNLKEVLGGHAVHRAARLRSRFEFSALPGDGGSVIPHTDAPGKIVTLVISMLQPGEWQAGYGGGTDVNKPKDPRRTFNQLNAQADFAAMDVLDTFEFTPNQAVVFVKTFNSWHSVRPMTGPADALRKTLTINIEA